MNIALAYQRLAAFVDDSARRKKNWPVKHEMKEKRNDLETAINS